MADADVVEESQPLADLLEDAPPDQHLGGRQLEPVDEAQSPGDRLLRELVDRLSADRDREHLGLEPRTVADGAGAHRQLLDPLPLLAGVGLPVPALEVRQKTLERHRVLALTAHPAAVRDEDPVAARPVQEPVLLLARAPPRRVQVDLVPVGDPRSDRLVEALAAERPPTARPPSSESRVGDEQVGSISSCEPRPVHRGHAPCGALNEKMRGSSSGSPTPCSGQAKFSLKRWYSPSTSSTATSPPASDVAVSTDG